MQGGTEILSVILQRQFVQAMGLSPGIPENFNIVLKTLCGVFQILCEKRVSCIPAPLPADAIIWSSGPGIKQLTDILRAHSGSQKFVRDFVESLV